MDFKDQIKQLSDRVVKLKDQIQTEEATKNAFVLPFIQILGYDVFNPIEVVPEYVCDIGTKKGEKIDYAIFKESDPILLIECKHWNQDLTFHDNQLLRYFHVSKAKFGLLTNGLTYRFYTDLEAPNKMDEKPFLEISLTDLKENSIEELKKFHKSYFDKDAILGTAADLKYTNEFKSILHAELANPSETFVKYFAKQVYTGVLTAKYVEYFTPILKKSFATLINDTITDRLKAALSAEQKQPDEPKEETVQSEEESKIATTVDELEGFMIIKAIVRQYVDLSRVIHKDTQTYFGIMIDNTRKTICRLYFNGKKRYITIIDENKKDVRIDIDTLDDIYKYSDEIVMAVKNYLNKE